MNIDPDQTHHATEPVDVNIKPSIGKTERMLECAMCGRPIVQTTYNRKFCKDPECVKHRHSVRQMEFYRSRPEYTGKTGRPQTVAEDKRSPQLEYYYKKKAGKANKTERMLAEI